MRRWLQDPSGLLTRLLPLVTSVDDAARFVRYFGDRGQLLTDGRDGLLLGVNEIAALLSFELEERAGRDLLEHYRWYGATPGEHGPAIEAAARALPPDGDRGWTERLRGAGLAVVDRAAPHRPASWEIVLSTEDI